MFVDDYSSYTWIYPLCNKFDVFQSFVKFKLLVENLFSSTIKQLQSYGGGEYTSQQFQLFLLKNGIIHKKSCPNTSQQNGLAKRKLHHILEIGLTFLGHSKLSNKYWVDAVLTVVLSLINYPLQFLLTSIPLPNFTIKN